MPRIQNLPAEIFRAMYNKGYLTNANMRALAMAMNNKRTLTFTKRKRSPTVKRSPNNNTRSAKRRRMA